MNKINELDLVALKKNFEDKNLYLSVGTVGTVVYKYGGSKAFEVEFVNASGATVGTMTLKPSDIRPLRQTDMLYVRHSQKEIS